MEDLIVFILLVVLGVIARGRRQSQKTKKPVKRYNNTLSLPKADSYSPVAEPLIIEEKTYEAKEKPDLADTQIETNIILERPINIKKMQNKKEPKNNIEISDIVTREGILKGIIMHEIFSPPKSLDNKRR